MPRRDLPMTASDELEQVAQQFDCMYARHELGEPESLVQYPWLAQLRQSVAELRSAHVAADGT